MILLLLILFNPVPGFDKYIILNSFSEWDTCKAEEVRITHEMALAYPGDDSYTIQCKLPTKEKNV